MAFKMRGYGGYHGKSPMKKQTDPPKKEQTLAGKNLREDVDIKGAEMRGSYGPKNAESASMIAKSDNIKSNNVTVKGKEKGYVPDNNFNRRKSVEKFSHEYNMKNDSKYRIAYNKKQKNKNDAEDAEYRKKNKK
tara:strand:- start:3437 stop:3838 length:402 start_codon:yes stop_codon:yes gene_type:complete